MSLFFFSMIITAGIDDKRQIFYAPARSLFFCHGRRRFFGCDFPQKIQLGIVSVLLPSPRARLTHGLKDIQKKIMKILPVDFAESERGRNAADHDQYHSKGRDIAKPVGEKNKSARDQENQKLPGRNGAENLIFDIDKLRNDELLHRGYTLIYLLISTTALTMSVVNPSFDPGAATNSGSFLFSASERVI